MLLTGDVNAVITSGVNMTKLDIIFGVATIVGTIIAIWQTIKARNQSKELARYEYLFDLADKGIEKEKTIEELKSLKEEKLKIDEAIKTDLPLLARKTVLSDRLVEDKEALVKCYNRYINTKEAYDKLDSENQEEIPKNILSEIENSILPDYVLKEKRDDNLRRLSIISYISALFSASIVTRNIGRIFLLATIPSLIRIYVLSLPKDIQKRKEYLISTFFKLSIGLTILFSIVLFYSVYTNYHIFSEEKLLLLSIILCLLFIVDLVIFVYMKKNKIIFQTKQQK